ncbi:unnamed protein product [Effrenium voratum]|uniref:Uncharacterized protein n=1 Tax=Effrenium voratum TaxID=2562239 RepID=A0AA36JNC2_9DINO|nr:unnamed protein product [Effrenium voratum]CAJ1408204.1 unnamed protein product [Effrenium voratum]CAJ1455491.1 unnamed protein product [Effrenium voratum]
MGCSEGRQSANDTSGGFRAQHFVTHALLPAEGLVRQLHTVEEGPGGHGDAEALYSDLTAAVCSYVLTHCTVQADICDLKGSEKGLEVTFNGVLIFPPDNLEEMKSNGRLFMHSHARKPHKLFHKRKHEAPQAAQGPISSTLKARIAAAERDESRYVLHVKISSVIRNEIYTRRTQVTKQNSNGSNGTGTEDPQTSRPADFLDPATWGNLFKGQSRSSETIKEKERKDSLQVKCDTIAVNQQMPGTGWRRKTFGQFDGGLEMPWLLPGSRWMTCWRQSNTTSMRRCNL